VGIKRHIGCITLLIFLLICLSQVIIAGNTRSADNVHLLFNQPQNGQSVIAMEKTGQESDESFDYAMWGEVAGQIIENPDFNRKHSADIIYVRGKTELFLNHTGYLDTKDGTGCLIDKESAWQLFGDGDAIGRIIKYDNKEYLIQGILEDMESVLVIPVTSKTIEVVNQVCLKIPEGKYSGSIIESFKSIYGIDATEVEYRIYRWVSNIWLGLIPLAMGIYFFAALLKQAFLRRHYPIIFWGYIGIGLVFFAVYIWITQMKFSLPQEFIPNKWSDFEFFSNLYEEKSQSIQLLLGTENPKPMMPYVNAFWQTLKYGALSVILWSVLHMIIRINDKRTLCIDIVFALTGAFLCVVLFQNMPQAVHLPNSRSLWLAPSVYFLGRYIVYLCRNFSKTL